MSLECIIGRSGSGKTTWMIEQIIARTNAHPDENIFIIAPDQMTYQIEHALLVHPKVKGLLNVQVYSMNRLAWRVCRETGGLAQTYLSSNGLNMLIRKLLMTRASDLSVFSKSALKKGFISQLHDTFREFKQYEVTPEVIQAVKENQLPLSIDLKDKITDIDKIYQHYLAATADKYLETEDYLSLLVEAIPQFKEFDNASFFIDGFFEFSPQEYSVLEQLLIAGKKMTMSFTMNQDDTTNSVSDLDLFQLPKETYRKMNEIARVHSIERDADIYLENNFQKEQLKVIEANFEIQSEKHHVDDEQLHVTTANNRRAEVEGIAREIRRLIVHHNYRYKDIAVFIRNEASYTTFLPAVFKMHELPFFIDEAKKMANHPLIELLRGSLEAITKNFNYDAMFQIARTELFVPPKVMPKVGRQRIDELENYVLARNYYGKKWFDQDEWIYRRSQFSGEEAIQTTLELEKQEQINTTRKWLTVPLQTLNKQLKQATNVREQAAALFYYMEELQVSEHLNRWRTEAQTKGTVEQMQMHEQAYKASIQLLDEIVEVMGDEKLSITQLRDVLDSGFEEMEFTGLPPTIDQITVANIQTSRVLNVKAAFVLGFNDGVYPTRGSDKGVFKEDDRQKLVDSGLPIQLSARQQLAQEDFYAYRALTSATEQLYISFPIADEEGRSLLASPYLRRLQQMFTTPIHQQTYLSDMTELPEFEQFPYIGHPKATLNYLIAQMQQLKIGGHIAPIWQEVYNWFTIKENEYYSIAKQALTSLSYENVAQPLAAKTAKDLFNNDITASVSRMEKFFGCHFSHFASHGLKLREREVYRLESVDIGQIFHSAMEDISQRLKENGIEWGSLTADDISQLAKDAIAVLRPVYHYEILLSSNKMGYISHKLQAIIEKAAQALNEQARNSKFSPSNFEVGFGKEEVIPALTLPLKEGTISLQGRIDRIDVADYQGQNYLRIIDYKSSDRAVDFTEVYHGIALQMLTYLDIAVTNAAKLVNAPAEAAGMMYFHMHNPFIEYKQELKQEDIEKDMLKEFKMDGWVLDNKAIVEMMDTTLEPGKTSTTIPVNYVKSGDFGSRSKVLSEQEFNVLRGFVRKQYQQGGNLILQGDVAINPYQLDSKTPCQFCDYRSICQFDVANDKNSYRVIESDKQADVLKKMGEELEQNDK